MRGMLQLSALLLLVGCPLPPAVASRQPQQCGCYANFSNSLNLGTAPTGNTPLTSTAFSVQGVTAQADQREYLVSLGLTSNTGAKSRPSPYHDKVTLYAGIVGEAGTGDIWAFNPLLTQSPNRFALATRLPPRPPAAAAAPLPPSFPAKHHSACDCLTLSSAAPRAAATTPPKGSSWISTTTTLIVAMPTPARGWHRLRVTPFP
jgi:hypothetical protein